MYTLLKEFIKPELMVLIPVLYLIGRALKKSAVADKNIPTLLGISGVFLSLLYLATTTTSLSLQNTLLLIFTGVTQGILLAGASVYVHQLIKQTDK